MGDYGYDDDDDYEGTEGNGPRALRDADKAKAREIKRLAALVEQQSKELAEFQKQARAESVKSLLTAKGVNPKVAALIPSDLEPNEAAVGAWLEAFSDVFNIGGPSDDADQSGAGAAQAATLNEEADPQAAALAKAWSEFQSASQGQAPTGVDQLAKSSIQKVAEEAGSFDEAVAALSKLPGFDVGNYRS